jgi:short subunit fatty acids transporter
MTHDPALAKEVRDAGHELVRQMLDYFVRERTSLNEIVFAALIIFSRIVRTHDAIKSLVSDEFYVEAAILVLTQFELGLDIAYTASEIEHATKWLSHEDRKWQVLSTKKKIMALFLRKKNV